MKKIFKNISLITMILLLIVGLSSCSSNTVKDNSKLKIGVVTGSLCNTIAKEHYPDCEVVYFNEFIDLAMALSNSKIDAYMDDEPVARFLCNEYKNQTINQILTREHYAYIVNKDKKTIIKSTK